MAWDFETEPDFQEKLDWIDSFVKHKVEPLVHLGFHPADVKNPKHRAIVKPLQEEVKAKGLWACHLGPELGGKGYGQVKLGLMNEILGRSAFAPTVFGCQAPDTGNAEIIAHYGTGDQKAKYLEPLLNNEIVSAFSMTEPQGGSDPLLFTCSAVEDGDEWVINGEKWFSTNARWSEFLIVMAVTDPDGDPYRRMSMFIVPTKTPGVEIVRDVAVYGQQEGSEGYVRYTDVRVPKDHLLGERGGAFVISQTRLGGGRIHHAMRTVGACKRALDLMCRRAASRRTRDGVIADKQAVQMQIADSYMELEQFRLYVLKTAWMIDKYKDYKKVRKDIAAIKALMPKVYRDIAGRALHIHGSLGVSPEMPFAAQVIGSFVMGIADGPTEVHKVTVARQHMREYRNISDPIFPDYSIPQLKEAALETYGDIADTVRELAETAGAD
ncbi:acyl-CoA dehydrogenase family protein [Maricaulis virginensis]|uniref:Acyl-CoA dehydrogenase n=1 Tax=Maricaulis virginensis TaxID=144022 RepID=A0A9W6IK64_9PROT|nr:acyl-CoA dehydrogenase family protein [Maricaulis virginensis]GLK51826.1 acyl-CoA dehydrogenase [Maricaulis virginensis]